MGSVKFTRRVVFGAAASLIGGPLARAAVAAPADSGTASLGDEPYWETIRQSFPARSGPVNLLNSGGGLTPQVAIDRLKRLIQITAEGGENLHPELRGHTESGSAPMIRELMADAFGCDADEIALTRNAMEGLALGLHGIDLQAGDEVITTRIDYDSCIEILRQRVRREGVVLKLIDIPLPAATTKEVVEAFEQAITNRTRMMLFCHMTNKNGQILPVRELCDLARRRGIVTVVDGAQSIGHTAFALRDLGCDIYATSLHKWWFAPRGTGFIYVRRDMIERVWPIWASWSGKPADSIAKFEDYGTGMKAVAATLPDVAAFNAAIGARRKEARLRHLRTLWSEPLGALDRVRLLTDPDPSRSCAIGAFIVDGLDSDALVQRLRSEHDIIVGSIKAADLPSFRGVSVAADLTNTPQQIERFVDIVSRMVRE